MKTSRSPFEVEQKYRLKFPKEIRAKLIQLKARKIAKGFEVNELFDHEGELRKQNSVLRVRRYGKKTILTFKGPRLKSKFKKRLEFELEVDYSNIKKILHSMGYKVFFHYAKKREIFHLGKVEVVLDHLERCGWFLEIEGNPKDINRAAALLGLKSSDIEHRSYPDIVSSAAGKMRKSK